MSPRLLAFVLALFLGAAASADPGPAPAKFTLSLPASAQAQEAGGSVTFVGTATVIIRYAGMTILTDPNFLHKGDHVHLGYGLKSKRLTDPAIPFEQLPPIDLIVLSHVHEDHFDKLVQEKLNHEVPIVTAGDGGAKLRAMGFRNVYALKNWETLQVNKGAGTLRVTSTPARHGPAGVAALLPETMGSILDFGNGQPGGNYRMYISGDTLVYDDIRDIPRRFPDIDLALLHLGGTRILGVVKVTMDGEDGVRMLEIVAPKHAIPIHYNDYTVFKSPLEDFAKAARAKGWEGRITYLKHGEIYRFTPAR
jgi:L-ascorbate metabolism protein UlaG (beta-lactamase superfamily)